MLPLEDKFTYRVVMLARNKDVIQPSGLFVAVELHKSVTLRYCVERVTQETQEPGRTQLLIDFLIRFSTPPVLDNRTEYGTFPLVDDTGKMRVHQDVLKQVIQLGALGKVDAFGSS